MARHLYSALASGVKCHPEDKEVTWSSRTEMTTVCKKMDGKASRMAREHIQLSLNDIHHTLFVLHKAILKCDHCSRGGAVEGKYYGSLDYSYQTIPLKEILKIL